VEYQIRTREKTATGDSAGGAGAELPYCFLGDFWVTSRFKAIEK
jgi:hypothetical protein